MTRGQRGRDLAKMEFAAAFFAIGFAAFIWIARPGGFGPMSGRMFWGGPLREELIIAAAGLLGVVVGLVWMARIYRADPEPDQRAWRYRDRDRDGAYRPRKTRGQRGRELAKLEFAAAILAIVATGLLFVAAPGFMGGGPPEWQTQATAVVAVVGVVVGFVWMIRIYRANPEPDQRAWRYRDRD